MPAIRPVSDLRNNFHEISELCHSGGEPVFITRNGKGDMVVMSMALFEKREAMLELYRKLGEAEAQSTSRKGRLSHDAMMKELRSRMR